MLKRRVVQKGNLIGLTCGLLLLSASLVQAHGVSVFAWVDGDTIHVESKFSGGRRPKAAPVEVYDAGGNLLLEGKTNDEGEFSFKVPRKTEMKVVLTAGMGHKAEWTIPLEDLQDASAPPTQSTAQKANTSGTASSGRPAATAMSGETPPPADTPAGLTAEDVRQAVETALDKKLKPVMKTLAETRRTGPSIQDVLGGIGYILGLVGLAVYFKHRRK